MHQGRAFRKIGQYQMRRTKVSGRPASARHAATVSSGPRSPASQRSAGASIPNTIRRATKFSTSSSSWAAASSHRKSRPPMGV